MGQTGLIEFFFRGSFFMDASSGFILFFFLLPASVGLVFPLCPLKRPSKWIDLGTYDSYRVISSAYRYMTRIASYGPLYFLLSMHLMKELLTSVILPLKQTIQLMIEPV